MTLGFGQVEFIISDPFDVSLVFELQDSLRRLGEAELGGISRLPGNEVALKVRLDRPSDLVRELADLPFVESITSDAPDPTGLPRHVESLSELKDIIEVRVRYRVVLKDAARP